MSNHDNQSNTPDFSNAEKRCPACGAKVVVDEVWHCSACGLNGYICNSTWFQFMERYKKQGVYLNGKISERNL